MLSTILICVLKPRLLSKPTYLIEIHRRISLGVVLKEPKPLKPPIVNLMMLMHVNLNPNIDKPICLVIPWEEINHKKTKKLSKVFQVKVMI